jgi:hypothetical protein
MHYPVLFEISHSFRDIFNALISHYAGFGASGIELLCLKGLPTFWSMNMSLEHPKMCGGKYRGGGKIQLQQKLLLYS